MLIRAAQVRALAPAPAQAPPHATAKRLRVSGGPWNPEPLWTYCIRYLLMWPSATPLVSKNIRAYKSMGETEDKEVISSGASE